VQVTAAVTGLKPGRSYDVRLVATNSTGTVDGAVETFATVPAADPTVTTSPAASILTTTATLTGTVDPNGSDTTDWFEYGTSSGYGSNSAKVDAGSGTAVVEVSAPISGLKAGTNYLVRLVAENSSGTSYGIGQVVDTAASSCVADEATISADEATIQQEESAIKSAETSLTQTNATIAASQSPSTATIAQDEAAVTQAQATVTADQRTLDQTTLRAPTAGTVISVNGSVGDTVGGSGSTSGQSSAAATSSSAAGQGAGATGASTTGASAATSSSSAFITIDSLTDLQVVSGFAEADATKLAVGDPATVTFSALPNTAVAGKVVGVSSTSTVVNNVVTYDTTISLINPSSEVKEGMTANVSVVVDSRNNVLELPNAAITTTGPASTVELLQNGKTTTTPIQIGLVGSTSTQIVGGLRAGDVVVIPTVSVAAAVPSTATTGGGGAGGLGAGGFGAGGGAGFGGAAR
jgi:multidrug efflux pump subunit AcrA (membrane-fusion protein)